jgi:hypothetical protein
MSNLSRRTLMGIGVVAAGAAAIALAAIELPLGIGRRYRHTAYDDLLGLLSDREHGARVGRAVLAELNPFDENATASALRRTVHGSFADAAAKDAVDGRLIEAGGWVLPASFALVCALAAESA